MRDDERLIQKLRERFGAAFHDASARTASPSDPVVRAAAAALAVPGAEQVADREHPGPPLPDEDRRLGGGS